MRSISYSFFKIINVYLITVPPPPPPAFVFCVRFVVSLAYSCSKTLAIFKSALGELNVATEFYFNFTMGQNYSNTQSTDGHQWNRNVGWLNGRVGHGCPISTEVWTEPVANENNRTLQQWVKPNCITSNTWEIKLRKMADLQVLV